MTTAARPASRFPIAFWRTWHRWLGFPAALFLCWAAATGFLVAFTEFFGEEEAKREATRDLVSPLRLDAPGAAHEALDRAIAAAQQAAPGAPVDKITLEFKGETPVVTVFTGKPAGGEDRRLVVDQTTGALVANESYADKPLLYRLHSGEAFGDGGLVGAMLWALALLWLTISGFVIYLRMRRPGGTGWKKIFW